MEFKEYTAEQFAQNNFFIRWVKHPDPDSDWFWRSFLKDHPEKGDEIRIARDLVLEMTFGEAELTDQEFNAMRHRISFAVRADKVEQRDDVPGLRSNRRLWPVLLKVAAVFIVGVLALYFAIRPQETKVTPRDVATATASENSAEAKHVTLRGEKSELLLSDGTKVQLNADSYISYSKDFNEGETRDVYLEGEGFFDVAHNADRPFIVHTSKLRIRVLGTSFNVKAYQDDHTIETTLITGKVQINKTTESGEDGSLMLKPNQKAVFEKVSQTINVEEVKAEKSATWRENRLVFDETPFNEVIKQLERRFDTHFVIEEARNLDCKLTGEIELEDLEEVMKLLVLTHQIEYDIEGNEVTVAGTLCE